MNNLIFLRSNGLKFALKLHQDILNMLLLYSCTKLSFGALIGGLCGRVGGQKRGLKNFFENFLFFLIFFLHIFSLFVQFLKKKIFFLCAGLGVRLSNFFKKLCKNFFPKKVLFCVKYSSYNIFLQF